MKPFYPAVAILTGCMLLSFPSMTIAQSTHSEQYETSMKFVNAVQASFPAPMPSSMSLKVRGGSGRIVFYAESPEYFGPKEQALERIEGYLKEIFGKMPDLDEIEVFLPYDCGIIGGTWSRAILKNDPVRVDEIIDLSSQQK